jgi:hypothetical protein
LIFGELCKLWSFLLCSFLQPLVPSYFLDPYNLLSILHSNEIDVLPFMWKTKFLTHTK